jgi:hypothetical protein
MSEGGFPKAFSFVGPAPFEFPLREPHQRESQIREAVEELNLAVEIDLNDTLFIICLCGIPCPLKFNFATTLPPHAAPFTQSNWLSRLIWAVRDHRLPKARRDTRRTSSTFFSAVEEAVNQRPTQGKNDAVMKFTVSKPVKKK